jgi:hypothetical protein
MYERNVITEGIAVSLRTPSFLLVVLLLLNKAVYSIFIKVKGPWSLLF